MRSRVLIVDDDADLAESLAEVLLDHGCDVSIAGHGREAVTLAGAEDFDVIFMDVRMPIMNGVDSFFAIRAIKPEARVVMMTGFKEKVVERAIQGGAEGPLHKPFTVDDMLALIEMRERKSPLRPSAMTPALSGTIH